MTPPQVREEVVEPKQVRAQEPAARNNKAALKTEMTVPGMARKGQEAILPMGKAHLLLTIPTRQAFTLEMEALPRTLHQEVGQVKMG
jgi:hypothetical protein